MDRNKKIIKTSILGIIANFFLAGFKATIGLLSGSIAIVLDAVNNLTDALSSGITVVGAKLSGKKPDKKPPYGYGRIENVSAMIVAVIVLYAGITSLIESVKKIFQPEVADYALPSLIIIGVAVLVKIFIGVYFQKVGKKVNSDALSASGKDALMDSVISASTLVAAVVFLLWGLSLEAYLGAIISLFIIKAGVEMIVETISQILGERLDSETTKAIKRTIAEFPEVYGAYDLILHNYGPGIYIGSVHIEIPDYMTADKIDDLEHAISEKVYEEHKVIIAGISIYSRNTKDENSQAILSEIRNIVSDREFVLQMHGFHFSEIEKKIHFDVIIDFAAPDREKIYEEILNEVKAKFPDYKVTITLDSDVSD